MQLYTAQVKQLQKFDRKCICQICTCGNHKCPHSDPSIPLQDLTSYKNDYIKHPIEPRKPPKQRQPVKIKPYGDKAITDYQRSYLKHPFDPVQTQKPVQQPYVKIPFKGNTDYKMNYIPKSVQPHRPPQKQKQLVLLKDPFDGTTTYKNDFTKKKGNPVKRPKQKDVQFPPGYKFNGQTTYNADYIPRETKVPQKHKKEQYKKNESPHDLLSYYQQQFTNKGLQQVCPILKMPKYPKTIKNQFNHYDYQGRKCKWVATVK